MLLEVDPKFSYVHTVADSSSIMETVAVDGQIFAYQTFLKNFVTNVNPEDPLPVRINNANITRVEVRGVVIDWILQYLSSW